MKKWMSWVVVAVVVGVAACGSDDGGEDAQGDRGGSSSFTAIAESVASPTGTVDATTAPEIALEFEKISAQAVAKSRQKQAQTQEMACPAGGVIVYEGQGDASGVRSTFAYEDCCYEGGCCLNGSGDWYYATQQGGSYTYCGVYDLLTTCDSSSVVAYRTQYEGCAGADGVWVYVVRVNGESFAVTGSYYGGNGTLEVRGVNGSFTCTYTNGSGSCTGTSGSFSF